MSIYGLIENLKSETGLALVRALDSLSKENFSEKNLAERWLAYLQRNPDLYKEGWYVPPPSGIITLFGKDKDKYQRVCQPSFRPVEMWPNEKIFYQPEDMMAVYASPVDRKTNLIGDFGLTLYRGVHPEIIEHLENVLLATLRIAKSVQVGMAFREIYENAMQHAATCGFMNEIRSLTDTTGTNIGHTIPLSYAGDPTHIAVKKAKTFEEIKTAISKGRKFINSQESMHVQDNMAFTIEPRFSTGTMPNTWFHTTVIVENRQQRICHGFRPVFEKLGMDRLLKLLQS